MAPFTPKAVFRLQEAGGHHPPAKISGIEWPCEYCFVRLLQVSERKRLRHQVESDGRVPDLGPQAEKGIIDEFPVARRNGINVVRIDPTVAG